MRNKIIQGDCLEVMKTIADRSVDLILCDLPYGKTTQSCDKKIDLDLLWGQYKRIIKDNGVVILTATQPFTSEVVISNLAWFKYELIWEKSRISNPLTNKIMPSRIHENILVFYKGKPTYNPIIFKVDEKYIDKRKSVNDSTWNNGQFKGKMTRKIDTGERQPQSVVFFPSEWSKSMHPTQKSVALFEYLIKTYTNEGDLVLDNCIGSGTTAVACRNLNRDFIGIELEQEYVNIANRRLNP